MLLPGQRLRGSLPLLSPRLIHSNLRRQVPPSLHDARDSSSEGWNYGKEYFLKWRVPRHFLGSFYMQQSTTWDRRLYFPSEGRRAEDFFAVKVRRLRSCLKPRTRVPEVSTFTPRPPKPVFNDENKYISCRKTTVQIQLIYLANSKLQACRN